MKKTTLLQLVMVAFTAMLTVSLHAQVKFTVKGKLPADCPAKRAALLYVDEGKVIKDTVNITNGAFEFKGAVTRPLMAGVSVIPGLKRRKPSEDRNITGSGYVPAFYIDGHTDIILDTSGIFRVTGGKEQTLWNEQLIEGTERRKNNIKIPFQEIVASEIKKNPDSYVTMDGLEFFASVMDPKVFEPMFNSLSKRMQNTREGKEWKAALALAKRLAIGQPSINFALNDTLGRSVSLASYKGKYVLLDFWASWCNPCRATHPDLIKAYGNYKDKNFEILAVSLDKEKGPWLKAIAEDKITWMQVSDLKGGTGKVPKMYGIKAIPQNFLIDPNGIIVGKNLEGEALDKKLSELLK